MERNTRYIIAVLWSLFVAFSCLISFNDIGEVKVFRMPHIDKIVHFGFYTVFTGVWLWSVTVKVHKVSTKRVLLVLLGAVAFGFFIELLQKFATTVRSFEWLDVLANFLGAITGTIVFLLMHRWVHKSQKFV